MISDPYKVLGVSPDASDEEIKRKLQRFPLHRAATAEEVAEAAVHTLRSGAMTGETVNINSGVYFAP